MGSWRPTRANEKERWRHTIALSEGFALSKERAGIVCYAQDDTV